MSKKGKLHSPLSQCANISVHLALEVGLEGIGSCENMSMTQFWLDIKYKVVWL